MDEKTLGSSKSVVSFDGLPSRSNYEVQVWPVDDTDKKGPVGRIVVATGSNTCILAYIPKSVKPWKIFSYAGEEKICRVQN